MHSRIQKMLQSESGVARGLSGPKDKELVSTGVQ